MALVVHFDCEVIHDSLAQLQRVNAVQWRGVAVHSSLQELRWELLSHTVDAPLPHEQVCDIQLDCHETLLQQRLLRTYTTHTHTK